MSAYGYNSFISLTILTLILFAVVLIVVIKVFGTGDSSGRADKKSKARQNGSDVPQNNSQSNYYDYGYENGYEVPAVQKPAVQAAPAQSDLYEYGYEQPTVNANSPAYGAGSAAPSVSVNAGAGRNNYTVENLRSGGICEGCKTQADNLFLLKFDYKGKNRALALCKNCSGKLIPKLSSINR